MVAVALGLGRILRGPADADRLMAVQLLGTGGSAALLLLAVATENVAVIDVALVLALLAAFVSAAFFGSVPPEADDREEPGGG